MADYYGKRDDDDRAAWWPWGRVEDGKGRKVWESQRSGLPARAQGARCPSSGWQDADPEWADPLQLAAQSRRNSLAGIGRPSFRAQTGPDRRRPRLVPLWLKPGGFLMGPPKAARLQQRIRPSRPAWITRVRRLRPGPASGAATMAGQSIKVHARQLASTKCARLAAKVTQRPARRSGPAGLAFQCRWGWNQCRLHCPREQRGGPYPIGSAEDWSPGREKDLAGGVAETSGAS